MATIFKVSAAEMMSCGLPSQLRDAMIASGYPIAWQGSCWVIKNAVDGSEIGYCKSKNHVLTPNHLFAAKVEEITGLDLSHLLAVIKSWRSAYPDIDFKAIYKTVYMKKHIAGKGWLSTSLAIAFPIAYQELVSKVPAGASPEEEDITTLKVVGEPSPSTLDKVDLIDAEVAGQKVFGTDSGSTYTTYLVSKDGNIAYRIDGPKLSIRVEKCTYSARKALVAWGLDDKGKNKKTGENYCSVHLQVDSPSYVVRTLGSLAATILTGPAKSVLVKGDVK